MYHTISDPVFPVLANLPGCMSFTIKNVTVKIVHPTNTAPSNGASVPSFSSREVSVPSCLQVSDRTSPSNLVLTGKSGRIAGD